MSKYEKRIFLDRLVDLRDRYRATDHVATAMTVTDAITYAEGLLDDPERLDAIVGDSTSAADSVSQ